MIAACATQAVRICIENAALLPPMMDPPPAAAPASATAAQSLRGRLGHLAPSFAARLPIGFFGIVEAAAGEGILAYHIAARLYLYRDCNGLPRTFNIAGHNRDGIASLFAGGDRVLARLWPARRGGWDAGAARETLICHQSGGKLVHGDGFALIAEGTEVQRAHLAIGRLAARLLWRGADPYQVLDLARGWNATRGQGALDDEAIEQIVDAACARELGSEDQRRAG